MRCAFGFYLCAFCFWLLRSIVHFIEQIEKRMKEIVCLDFFMKLGNIHHRHRYSQAAAVKFEFFFLTIRIRFFSTLLQFGCVRVLVDDDDVREFHIRFR